MMIKINKWDGFRIALIAVALGGVAVVLGDEFLSDKNEQKAAIKVTFPENIPLSNWKPIQSKPKAAKSEDQSDVGKLYQYRKANETLFIEARHQFYTDGNAKSIINCV